MAPSTTVAGSYTATSSPTATYEWRAVFYTPAYEGVVGSGSTPLKITVSGGCVGSGCPQSAQP
jgi:hypothetical protein